MLDQLLHNAIAVNPQKTMLVCGGQRISYGEFDARIGGFAKSLQSLGLREAERVTILLPNCSEFVIALFAAARLRALVQPLDPLLEEGGLRKCIDDAGPRILITDPERLDKSRRIIAAAHNHIRLIVTGTSSGGELSFDELVAEENGCPRSIPAFGGRSVYLYTSGSSGTPKRICRTQRNLCCESWNVVRSARLTPFDNILCTIPLHHSYGLEMCLMAAVAAGSTLVLLESYSESGQPMKVPFAARSVRVVELIEREDIRIFPAVAHQFATLAQLPPEQSADFSGIRLCISSGNALPREVYDCFLRRFGIPIRQSYGSSEAGTVTLNLDVGADFRPESVGTPVQNVCVKVVDDNGEEVPRGEIGHILIKSPVLPENGYDNRVDLKQRWSADGYYRSEDLGLLDADGRLCIAGRKPTFIDTGGYKVNPQEVEDVIKAHPAVREVVVIGVPVVEVGEIVKAVVVPEAECDEQQIKAYCRERLASFKVPRQVEFRSELPRSSLGKILEDVLRTSKADPANLRSDDDSPNADALSPAKTATPKLYQELIHCPQDRLDLLVSHLQTQIAAMLDRAPSEISRHAAFEHLGFNSLLAVEFSTWLETSLGVSLSSTVVWNYPTLDTLAQALLERLTLTEPVDVRSTGSDGFRALAPPQPRDNSRIDVLLAEIEGLSEDEVYERLSENPCPPAPPRSGCGADDERLNQPKNGAAIHQQESAAGAADAG